ncbi:hypothetical protein BU051_00845 [Staphylococcus simulans]|nr:hypothetical protein BU051_00845 [Staphylococcus simulans]
MYFLNLLISVLYPLSWFSAIKIFISLVIKIHYNNCISYRRGGLALQPKIYKISISIILIAYSLISLFVYFNESLNSLLFVCSFLIFALLVIKPLIFNGSLHLFNYVFSRFNSKISKKKQPKTPDTLFDHYKKVSQIRKPNYFWILISLSFFIATIFIALFHSH